MYILIPVLREEMLVTVTALLFLITLFFAFLPISRRAHFFAHSSELWIGPASDVQLSEGDIVNG